MFNQVQAIVRITETKDIQTTQTGTSILKFRAEACQQYIDKTGEQKQSMTGYNFVIWGKRAETMKTYLVEGQHVFLTGSISYSTYEDRETGEERRYTDIRVDDLKLLGETATESLYLDITLLGRLGVDPTRRKGFTSFTVITEEHYTSNGEKKTKTTSHSCTAWDHLADPAMNMLSKGQTVQIKAKVRFNKHNDVYYTDLSVFHFNALAKSRKQAAAA